MERIPIVEDNKDICFQSSRISCRRGVSLCNCSGARIQESGARIQS